MPDGRQIKETLTAPLGWSNRSNSPLAPCYNHSATEVLRGQSYDPQWEYRVPHAPEWSREGPGCLCRKSILPRGGTSMPDGQLDKEDTFDFDSSGEALDYISLPQARLLAMQTARESPGNYGRRFSGVPMAFEVAQAEEDEDYYNVTLSFRPQGQFSGTPGQEQFFIEKEGAIAHRQVLGLIGQGQ